MTDTCAPTLTCRTEVDSIDPRHFSYGWSATYARFEVPVLLVLSCNRPEWEKSISEAKSNKSIFDTKCWPGRKEE
jgi:hypothetical protein